MTRLTGKTAVITGASAGIGAAIAERFVAEGASVLLSDLAEESGQALARRLGQRFMRADVASSSDRDALFDVDSCLPVGPIGGLHVHLVPGPHAGIRSQSDYIVIS